MTDIHVISSQLKDLQNEVVEFNVGVSHLALDEERERHTRIRERIESFMAKIKNSHNNYELENAKRILTIATSNTDTLRYLESISCLENIFTDATKAVTIKAVDLSAEGSTTQQVLQSRFLTDSVRQCWEYAAQLSNLVAIHLKAAADFHIFNHEANEVRAHAVQMKEISKSQLETFAPDGRIMEASTLTNEMNERLSAFQNLATRARALIGRAPSVLPVENRLLEVKDGVAKESPASGPLMVQMLMDYVGSNFSVRKGDSLALIDTTENPYLWKVMTSNGPQYVPSITCIVPSANGELIHDAYRTLVVVKESWNDALDNYKRQLANYYAKYLMAALRGRGLHITDPQAMRRFVDDIDRLLIQSGSDEGTLTNVLNQIPSKTVSRMERADVVWSQSELSVLHQPLTVLSEHMKTLKRIDENFESIRELDPGIAMEARGLQEQLESLRTTHDQNQTELKELYDRVHNWKSVYTDSLEGPTTGIGRLFLSSLSSSSGISSEEVAAIPLPPSPFGRITPTELPVEEEVVEVEREREEGVKESVEEAVPEREFLGTRSRRPPSMHVANLGAKEEPVKSKVFNCGANLQPRQMKANLNVKPVEKKTKPKMVRDVAIQKGPRFVIQNTQTELSGDLFSGRVESSQSESTRVDSMTQIGCITAQKAQQVDMALISAAMEVTEPAVSIASGLEGAIPERRIETYATGKHTRHCETATEGKRTQDLMFQINEPASIDSSGLETHIPTGTADLDTRSRSRDIITQISQMPPKTYNFGIQQDSDYDTKETVHMAAKPKRSIGKAEFSRALGDFTTQIEVDTASIQLDATKNLGDLDTSVQGKPKSSGLYNGSRPDQRSHYDFETSRSAAQGPSLVEANINTAKRRPKVAAECTCMKREERNVQTAGETASGSFACFLHQPMSVHFTPPCYASCETPMRTREAVSFHRNTAAACCQVGTRMVPRSVKVSAINVSVNDRVASGKLQVPMNSVLCPASVECQPVLTEDAGIQMVDLKEVDVVQLQTGGKTYLTGVQARRQDFKQATIVASANQPEVCVIEFATRNPEIGDGSIYISRHSSDCSNNTPRRVLTGAECQFTISGVQGETLVDSSTEMSGEISTSKSYSDSSCQVGTVLIPETLEVESARLKLADVESSKRPEMNVGTVVCPTRVVVTPKLTETSGINVAGMKNTGQINVRIADRLYNASMAYQDFSKDQKALCVISLNSESRLVGASTNHSSKDHSSAGLSVHMNGNQASTSLTSPHHLDTTYGSTMASRTPTESKSTQVGAILRRTELVSTQAHRRFPHPPTPVNFSMEVQNTSTFPTASSGVDQVLFTPTLAEIQGIQVRDWTETSIPGASREYANIQSTNMQKAATSVSSTTYQPIYHQTTHAPMMKNSVCQVGVRLRPTRVNVANIEIRPRTAEMARQMAVTPNAIICPSTVELQTELAESAGIQVMDVKDVATIELHADNNLYEATFNRQKSRRDARSIPHSQPLIRNMNIACSSGGGELTLGRAETLPTEGAFELQDVGCSFEVRNTAIRNVCAQCRERFATSSAYFTPVRSASIDSRNPSFIHQRASTPMSKSVECQVGLLLKPTAIQVANIGLKPRNRVIADYMGMPVDSLMCPARVQVAPEIHEAPGIQIANVPDVRHLEVQAGGAILNANVQTRRQQPPVGSTGSQKKPGILLDIQGSQQGLTIGKSSAHTPVSNVATTNEYFTLHDVGCEVVIKSPVIGAVCTTCQGSGRRQPTEVVSLDASHTYSALVPATMMTRPTASVASKSCQVGTVLTPTCLNIAGVEMIPKTTNSSTALSSYASVVYPAAVESESRLVEGSGIQIRDVATMDSINIKQGGRYYQSTVQSNPKAQGEAVVLEVRSGGTATAIPGRFNLRNVGCEFVIRKTSTSESGTVQRPVNVASSSLNSIPTRHAYCQVGLELIPRTVQVADVSASVSEPRIAVGLGLRANAIICPSTVDLEARLTDHAGVTVTDIRDVKEVGITVGNRRAVMSITGRNFRPPEAASGARTLEPAYLSFVSSRPPVGSMDQHAFNQFAETAITQSSKVVDQNARCTFLLKMMSDSQQSSKESPASITMQHAAQKANATCQVGVLMMPSKMSISSARLMVNEKASSDALGISKPSVIQPTTCELEVRLSESSGIQLAQMSDMESVQIQVGGQTYRASVLTGSRSSGKGSGSGSSRTPLTQTSISNYPTAESTRLPSSVQRRETNIATYLVTLREGATNTQSVLEVGAVDLSGRGIQLAVNGDLRGLMSDQTVTRTGGNRFTGFLRSPSAQSVQSSIEPSERSGPHRPTSRLCDVACEALIKPETLEKRLQTMFL